MSHIFISFSRNDGDYANKLAEDIRKHGFDVWIDEIKASAEPWTKTIAEGVKDCSALVVVMTPDSEKSQWVEAQLILGQRYNKPILPILLTGQQFDLLIPFEYVDARNGSLPNGEFYRRLKLIVDPQDQKGDNQKVSDFKDHTDIATQLSSYQETQKGIITKTHEIFLSYSRDDVQIMEKVQTTLSEHGFKIWTDIGIEIGSSSWKTEIEEAILASRCLVVILSPTAAKSKWVRAELDFAELHNKKIFPILAKGSEQDSVPFGFATAQWIDIRLGTAYEKSLINLINTIRGLLAETMPK